jgi:SAM-dependent methyltransferase
MEQHTEILEMNKRRWDEVAERFFGRTALPEYGPFSFTEDDLGLFGDMADQKVLDIGCGSGHSLQYMGTRGAKELWGLDISKKQIETADRLLHGQQIKYQLFESAMEEDPGLPHGYFDVVYSIYALGWTVDLKRTMTNVHNYLKPGGTFIFSWEHPMHDRFAYNGADFVLKKSYVEEKPEYNEAWNGTVIIHHRKISTYINTLIQTGFTIEKVIDDVLIPDRNSEDSPTKWYSKERAKLVPATFIVKVKKIKI